ncbi:cytochrome c oxidase subunit 2A [Fredinandcohnia sp. QZ13]|uniref:cytochrome c oxidase subunit 2A n=1 Tax=Fredinandcohnia sp. QZ13 TaxID=3073144 RepID=UPI00285314A0|nr:cytochrome c oxidase subunit 2A [Fredinandcohnia sp. QZ13]MDR4888645.1 cytochrome c oxidase subunit 2A [Fredinandcohnia sp. QZ13]
MAKTELTKTNQKTKIEDEKTSLKGTLASVLLLGLFLILSWLAVFFLFLDRV